MPTIKKQKNKVKVKPFVFGVDSQESAQLKVSVALESVGYKSTQLAGLVLSLIKFELIRRNAYPRWKMFLHQVGLRLWDLIAYLNVLYDDEELIKSLKAYYYKSKTPDYDKVALLREANELYEQLIRKINSVKVLNDFAIHNIRTVEQIVE